MKKLMVVLFLFVSVLFLNSYSSAQEFGEATREEVLQYMADLQAIRGVAMVKMNKIYQKAASGSSEDLFSNILKVQQDVLSSYEALDVPDEEDVRDYNDYNITFTEGVINQITAGMEQDMAAFQKLSADTSKKGMELVKLESNLKLKYKIADDEIKSRVGSEQETNALVGKAGLNMKDVISVLGTE